jgi:hypothetical protein
MSRSKSGSKGPGYDYWGRRAHSGTTGVGRIQKKMTIRVERARAKQKLIREEEDLNKIMWVRIPLAVFNVQNY